MKYKSFLVLVRMDVMLGLVGIGVVNIIGWWFWVFLEVYGNYGWLLKRIWVIILFCVNGGYYWVINGSEVFFKGFVEGSGVLVGLCLRIKIFFLKDLEY